MLLFKRRHELLAGVSKLLTNSFSLPMNSIFQPRELCVPLLNNFFDPGGCLILPGFVGYLLQLVLLVRWLLL